MEAAEKRQAQVNRIFSPHGETQNYLMHFLAGEGSPHTLWMACGTKWGKTLGASGAMAFAVPRKPNTTWRWIAPIYKQSRIAWKYLDRLWPASPFVRDDKMNMIKHLTQTKCELQFWHGQHPEDLEGEGVHGQIKDECSKMKEQVHISGRTCLTQTGGREANISTPRGKKNWFFKGCQRARQEMIAAKHEKRPPKEIFLTAPTLSNPKVSRANVLEAKRTLADRIFRQYYLAEFVDDGNVFPVAPIDRDAWLEPYQPSGSIDFWVHPRAKDMTVVAGGDWAKTEDYTVITLWNFNVLPFRIVGFMRIRGERYTNQIRDVIKLFNKFKMVEHFYHDGTGVGKVVEDLLDEVPNMIHKPITFSNTSKSNMVNSYIAGLEKGDVIHPWWPALQDEHDVYEVNVSELGAMKYGAPQGSHDDIVTSCFLGYLACMDHAASDSNIMFVEDLVDPKYQKDTLDNYYFEALDIDPDEGF